MTTAKKSSLLPRVSLADAVYEKLREEIVETMNNGDVLSQVQLAEQFGVSRIPVREALRRLQAESLVVATPYHQFVVRKPTGGQILELVDIREVLEDHALLQRGPVTPHLIAELRGINKEMKKARAENFLALDHQFHQTLAGSETMVAEVILDLRSRIHNQISKMVNTKPGRGTATAEHDSIVDALEAGDLELARRLMREHVRTSRDFIAARIPVAPTESSE